MEHPLFSLATKPDMRHLSNHQIGRKKKAARSPVKKAGIITPCAQTGWKWRQRKPPQATLQRTPVRPSSDIATSSIPFVNTYKLGVPTMRFLDIVYKTLVIFVFFSATFLSVFGGDFVSNGWRIFYAIMSILSAWQIFFSRE
ncbi:hypothetical protein GN278_07460 [Rhodobacteraceae bacterium Araon29]